MFTISYIYFKFIWNFLELDFITSIIFTKTIKTTNFFFLFLLLFFIFPILT